MAGFIYGRLSKEGNVVYQPFNFSERGQLDRRSKGPKKINSRKEGVGNWEIKREEKEIERGSRRDEKIRGEVNVKMET